ncbi:MAG: hypothetical protein WDO71_21655 [Bacteroidota bacterium]
MATLMSIVISLVVYVISLYYSNFSWLIVLWGISSIYISPYTLLVVLAGT